MRDDGVERAIGIVMAPHWSGMSVETYVERVLSAVEDAGGGPAFSFVRSYHDHPAFVRSSPRGSRTRSERLAPDGARAGALVLFTAHSLPTRSSRTGRCGARPATAPASCRYRDGLQETADLVPAALGLRARHDRVAERGSDRRPLVGTARSRSRSSRPPRGPSGRRRVLRGLRGRPPRDPLRPRHRGEGDREGAGIRFARTRDAERRPRVPGRARRRGPGSSRRGERRDATGSPSSEEGSPGSPPPSICCERARDPVRVRTRRDPRRDRRAARRGRGRAPRARSRFLGRAEAVGRRPVPASSGSRWSRRAPRAPSSGPTRGWSRTSRHRVRDPGRRRRRAPLARTFARRPGPGAGGPREAEATGRHRGDPRRAPASPARRRGDGPRDRATACGTSRRRRRPAVGDVDLPGAPGLGADPGELDPRRAGRAAVCEPRRPWPPFPASRRRHAGDGRRPRRRPRRSHPHRR